MPKEDGIEDLSLEKWIGSIIITKELVEKYEPQIFRDNKNRISRFTQAGWSFSSFGGTRRVREKDTFSGKRSCLCCHVIEYKAELSGI